jgi:hypothetical protein
MVIYLFLITIWQKFLAFVILTFHVIKILSRSQALAYQIRNDRLKKSQNL